MNPMQKPTAMPPSGGAGTPPMQQGGYMPQAGMAPGAPGPQMPDFLVNPTLPPEQVFNLNPTVQEVLWRRIDMLNEQQVALLDQAITPENAMIFLAIFPELEPLILEATALDQPQGGGAAPGAMPMAQPPGPMTPPPAGQAGVAAGAPMPPKPGGGSRLAQMKFQG